MRQPRTRFAAIAVAVAIAVPTVVVIFRGIGEHGHRGASVARNVATLTRSQ
jgi:hypothetical protein